MSDSDTTKLTPDHSVLLANVYKEYGDIFYDKTSSHYMHDPKQCLRKKTAKELIKKKVLKMETSGIRDGTLSHELFRVIIQDQKRGWSGIDARFKVIVKRVEDLKKKCDGGLENPIDSIIGPWSYWKGEKWLQVAMASDGYGRGRIKGEKIKLYIPCGGDNSDESDGAAPSSKKQRIHDVGSKTPPASSKTPPASSKTPPASPQSRIPTWSQKARSGKEKLSAHQEISNSTMDSTIDLAWSPNLASTPRRGKKTNEEVNSPLGASSISCLESLVTSFAEEHGDEECFSFLGKVQTRLVTGHYN